MDKAKLEEKRQYWLVILENWKESGQSKAGFCRERNLPVWQFRYWHSSLRKASSETDCGFVRVRAFSENSGIRLRTSSGLEIELDTSFDERTLKRFLSALTSSC